MSQRKREEREFVGLQFHEKIRLKPGQEGPEEAAKKAFVVGVLGDFRSTSDQFATEGAERFVSIDRYNFDDVMGAMAPGCSIEVANHIQEKGSPFQVSPIFQKINYHP